MYIRKRIGNILFIYFLFLIFKHFIITSSEEKSTEPNINININIIKILIKSNQIKFSHEFFKTQLFILNYKTSSRLTKQSFFSFTCFPIVLQKIN